MLQNLSHLTSLHLLTPQLKDLRILLSSRFNCLATLKSLASLPKLQSLFIEMPDMFSFSFFSPLATFIATRVEMPSYTTEGFRLQLRFAAGYDCRAAYIVLQRSPEVGKLDADVLALINSWKKGLVEGIPCLSSRYTPKKFNKLKHWRRLHQLFNAVEGYDIPKSGYLHVSDSSWYSVENLSMLICWGTLKVSKLHFLMRGITRELYRIPGNKHYHFSSRAKALLARWEPILLHDVRYYQWLYTDPTTSTYVPKQAGVFFFTTISSTFKF